MTAGQVLNWSYDRWTRELARFFFDGNYPGEIVAFCADGPTLATMTGEPEMVAIESLRAAVKPLVMPGTGEGDETAFADETAMFDTDSNTDEPFEAA